jgi:hypothetical protein
MAHDPLTLVLERLTANGYSPRQRGDTYTCRCPSHDDRNPSLTLAPGDKGVVLTCHAGCTHDQVCQALGLRPTELFYDHGAPKAEIVAVYLYEHVVDGDVVPWYEVVRLEPGFEAGETKTFRQRLPGATRYGLKGRETILYRLPQVLDAAAKGQTVFVVEGEKDVQALEHAGYVATCNPGGAGKWKDAYSKALVGARVAVCIDRDQPHPKTGRHVGYDHGRQVQDSLLGHGVNVIGFLEPAVGKDVADHLRRGLGVDKLVAAKDPYADKAPETADDGQAPQDSHQDAVQDSPPPTPDDGPVTHDFGVQTWADFRDSADDHVPMLVDELLPAGGICFIAAPPKAGKTWLALHLGLCVATDSPFLGSYQVDAGPVLYVALEGAKAGLKTRLGAMARGVNVDPDQPIANLHLSYKPLGVNLRDPLWAGALTRHAMDDLGCKLVVVDVLRAAAQVRESGDGAMDFAELVANLAPMTREGVTVCLLHHFTKRSQESEDRQAAERMSGSGALYGSMDSALLITSPHGAMPWRVEHVARDVPELRPFAVTMAGETSGPHGGYTYRDTLRLVRDDSGYVPAAGQGPDYVKATPMEIRDWIIKVMGGSARPKEIREAFGLHDQSLIDRRRALESLGVRYVKDGNRSRYEVDTSVPDLASTGTTDGAPEGWSDEPYVEDFPF